MKLLIKDQVFITYLACIVSFPTSFTGDNALHGTICTCVKHVEGFLKILKLETMGDEGLDINQSLGNHINGNRVAEGEERKTWVREISTP